MTTAAQALPNLLHLHPLLLLLWIQGCSAVAVLVTNNEQQQRQRQTQVMARGCGSICYLGRLPPCPLLLRLLQD
jgi:hypothetical protein